MSERNKFKTFFQAVLTNPVEAALFIPEHITRRHEYQPAYEPEPDWEARLHTWLGAPWPCRERAKLDSLWLDIASELPQGLGFGRQTYGEYSDAEISLSRAVWCIVLHQRPSVVVETGVAHGVTSRIVLEAFNRNAVAMTLRRDGASSFLNSLGFDPMKKSKPLMVWALGLILLFGFFPLLSLLLALLFALPFGCELDEGSVHPCVVLGLDFGSLLYAMLVGGGWLAILTIPLAGLALIVWLIVFVVLRLMRRPR
jgi:hypothetical protein